MSNTRIKSRTSSQWSTLNPVLRKDEPGFNSTNNRLKIGNGVTAWNDLSYVSSGGGTGLPDWIVEDNSALPEGGIQRSPNGGQLNLLSGHQIAIQDVAAEDNSGNGLFWESGTSDGDVTQGVLISTGPDGEHSLEFKGDGVLKVDGSPIGVSGTAMEPLSVAWIDRTCTLHDSAHGGGAIVWAEEQAPTSQDGVVVDPAGGHITLPLDGAIYAVSLRAYGLPGLGNAIHVAIGSVGGSSPPGTMSALARHDDVTDQDTSGSAYTSVGVQAVGRMNEFYYEVRTLGEDSVAGVVTLVIERINS